ncbi:unnamed protein product [Somion occarium]|uniref:Uncharacterized protein n=1 Tax=Somion occarium TaxID=3059160 RepID=A0ABP1DSL4_9APHY
MGGGYGAHGSGVAGGYEGNTQGQSGGIQGQSQNTSQGQSQGQGQGQGQGQEKADWLDKGITMVGKKFGMNVSEQNADKAGDFANKEAKQYGGRNLPGVQ